LVFVLGAAVAVGDTDDVVGVGSTIGEASGIYRYVPALSYRGGGGWAARELGRIRDASGGSRRAAGLSDRFTHAYREDPFHHAGSAGGAGSRGGTDDETPEGFGERPGPAAFDVGLALPSEVMTADEYTELLGELPEGTFELADFLVAYTDGPRRLIFDLNRIVQSRLDLDWEAIVQSLAILDGEEADVEEKPRGAVKRAAKKALENAAAASEKPSRSMLRIVIGFVIGMMLWFVVRKL
jgi:hypothetical protein